MYRLIQALVVLVILGGCASSRNGGAMKEQEFTPSAAHHITMRDKRLVVEKGDRRAYNELRIAYLEYPIEDEFLYYAMVMCNKYGDAQACDDIFSSLLLMHKNINDIDSVTANVAVMYLLKAYRKKWHQAVFVVERHSIVYDEATNREQLIRMRRRLNIEDLTGSDTPDGSAPAPSSAEHQ